MNAVQVVRRVLDGLDALSIPYVLVGSFASNIYGLARATRDADVVVQAGAGMLSELMRLLGPEYRRDPQIQFETITGTRKHFVEHLPTKFELEIFELSDDPHDQSRFARRRKAQIYGGESWVLTAEDVLVTKLNWLHRAARTKDMLDVQQVIAVQGDVLDWPYVEHWCDIHGSRPLLEKIRDELRRP
jgi:hypothetical protein